MIKINVEQGSEAWFQNKLGRLTASKYSTLMSGKSTKGYNDLIHDISCEIISGKMEETYSNDDMQRGTELEGDARKLYEELFDKDVSQIGLCIPDEDNEFHNWIGISPDGICEEGLLEIKCPKAKTHWNYIQKGIMVTTYRWQVQGQLYVTGAEWCDFMSYHPDLKPFIIRVYPDEQMHNELETRIRETIVLIKNQIENYNKYNYKLKN